MARALHPPHPPSGRRPRTVLLPYSSQNRRPPGLIVFGFFSSRYTIITIDQLDSTNQINFMDLRYLFFLALSDPPPGPFRIRFLPHFLQISVRISLDIKGLLGRSLFFCFFFLLFLFFPGAID